MDSPAPTTSNAERVMSKVFAEVFRAYIESSDEVQEVIRDMCQIINSPDTDADEKDAAVDTLAEALFPTSYKDELGIEIGDLRAVGVSTSEQVREEFGLLDEADSTFAERLRRIMGEKSVTQAELADAIGVQQPAVSMMLKRACHPQRRTVLKIAEALGVPAEDLWPSGS